MTELQTTRAQEVHNKLALTGKYFNTGKVLMGISYEPRRKEMTQDEELIQNVMLGDHGPRITAGGWGYLALVVVLFASVFVACST